MFILLSCVQFKRGDYLAPLLPGVAIFLGCAGEQWYRQPSPRGRRWAVGSFAGVLAATAGGWLAYENAVVPGLDARQDHRPFAADIRSHAGDESVTLFRVENHGLAFHLDRPVRTVLAWDELRASGTEFVVIPAGLIGESRSRLSPRAVEILSDSRTILDRPRRPLLLLRISEP